MSEGALAETQIGNYVIEREIGRGGMGIVYSAVHLDRNERVAVKLIAPHLLSDLRHRRRFFQEAHVTSRLQHPGFVRILDYGGDTAGQPYILMEYLDGCSLRQALSHAPFHRLSVEVSIHVAVQLADALDSAHQAGLIHRDIKPSNLMLLDDPAKAAGWRIKLLDFGLARLLSSAAEGATITESEIIGTPAYMSPEQCQGRPDIDGRSDVYALGAVLFEMLCGRTPFVGDPPRVMYQHVYTPPPSAQKFCSEVSSELSQLIGELLAKDPADRPTMGQVKARLHAQCQGAASPAPHEQPPIHEQLPPQAAIRLRHLVGVGLLCSVGGAALGPLWLAVAHRSAPRGAVDNCPVVCPAPPPSPAPAAIRADRESAKASSPAAPAPQTESPVVSAGRRRMSVSADSPKAQVTSRPAATATANKPPEPRMVPPDMSALPDLQKSSVRPALKYWE